MDSPRLGCFAFLAAAVAPAVAVALLLGTASAFFPAFIAAGAHAALIGLPLYLMLDLRYRITFPLIMGASILVGAVPIPLAVFLPFVFGGFGDMESVAMPALVLGAFGACGGLAFWLVLKVGRRLDSCR
jgi:hypothetical protein